MAEYKAQRAEALRVARVNSSSGGRINASSGTRRRASLVASAWIAMCLLLASVHASATDVVEMTAPVIVYDRTDPAFCWNCRSYTRVEVTERARLAALDGLGPEDPFADYLADGGDAEQALAAVVSGGQLRLVYSKDEPAVHASVTYRATRALSPEELALLAEYTRGQLLDGIGAGFTQSGTYAQKVAVVFDVMQPRSLKVVQRPSGPAAPAAAHDQE